MIRQGEETTVELPFFTDKNSIDNGFKVIVVMWCKPLCAPTLLNPC